MNWQEIYSKRDDRKFWIKNFEMTPQEKEWHWFSFGHIYDVSKKLVNLAKKYNRNQFTNFNDIILEVTPTSNPADIEALYFSKHEIRCLKAKSNIGPL